ncbi:TPA: hypothetical protein L6676_000344 [Escherichia coli]|nr:hypothetical protein [Escherichia coli]
MSIAPELVQSLKAAALKAKRAKALYRERKIMISECASEMKEYLDYSDDANNMLALVEALEAAGKQIAEHNFENRLLANADRDIKALRQRIAELEARLPTGWINNCDKSVPAALRYLADNPRPTGGNSSFNTEHLIALAREIELTASAGRTPTVKLSKRSVGEVMHMSGFSREYAEGWCSGNDNARHEIRLAGIALEDNCCAHSSAFLDVSGQRCSLCEAAHIGDEGE